MSYTKREADAYSKWKPKSEIKVEKLENTTQDLPDNVSCYKLMNGTKVYFRHQFPHELYVNIFDKCRDLPGLPLLFAGEIDNSLYFYSMIPPRCDSKTKTFIFYKASCTSTGSISLAQINEFRTEEEMQFAIQQPYFLIMTQENVIFESFDGCQLTLHEYNSNYLKGIKVGAFIISKQFAIIFTRNNEGTSSVTPPPFFRRQMCIISLQKDIPFPTSAYCQDNSLPCVLCGDSLLIFRNSLKWFKIKLDRPYRQIVGISNSKIFLNAPNLFCALEKEEFMRQTLFDGLTTGDEGIECGQSTSGSGNLSPATRQGTLSDYMVIPRSASSMQSTGRDIVSEYASEFFKKFKVMDILGEGGFGCVLKVINKYDSWEYAVKRIAVAPSKIEKALDEVRAMAKLDHPSIVRYHSTWIEEPPEDWQYDADCQMLKNMRSTRKILSNSTGFKAFVYIQMQLCKISLADWLKENASLNSRCPRQIKSWFKQIVEGVKYIHDKEMIHRDLKPSNIMFDENNHVKICDLGIVSDRTIDNGEEISVDRTQICSLLYMSPEQSSYFPCYSSTTDVFTLGLIFSEMYVVMRDDERFEMFNNYRQGITRNKLLEDNESESFAGWLAAKESKDRPSCAAILGHPILASDVL